MDTEGYSTKVAAIRGLRKAVALEPASHSWPCRGLVASWAEELTDFLDSFPLATASSTHVVHHPPGAFVPEAFTNHPMWTQQHEQMQISISPPVPFLHTQ